MFKKRIFFTFLGIGFLLPSAVWAMELGDLKLESALNQPFKAAIPIEDPGVVQENQIKAGLAPTQINDSISEDQQAILSDLRFQIINENNGHLHVDIQGQQPIREPFLRLPLMLSSPKGELVREYTVLIDPAVPPNTAKTITAAPSSGTSSDSQITKQKTVEKTVYGPIQKHDDLWQIASHYQQQEPNTSVQQWAFAIYSANQHAFIKGDIGQLKSGVYLQIPTLSVVMSHSNAESRQWMNDNDHERKAAKNSKPADQSTLNTTTEQPDENDEMD